VYIAWRSRNLILRVLAAAALVTAVVYVFTPLTAAGQEGSPTGFFTNTRYLIPGLVLALALLPVARPLRAPDGRAWKTLLFLTGVYAITVLTTPRWFTTYIFGTIFLTLALVWAPSALSLGRVRGVVSRQVVAAAAVAIVLLAVVLGRAQQVQYADNHYANPLPFLGEGGPREAYSFARRQHDKRIGIIGSSEIIFGQYGFQGGDLSNHVQWLGRETAHKGYARIPTCAEWRQAVDAGGFDYVVTTFDPFDPGTLTNTPEGRWTGSDPNAKRILAQGPLQVFEIQGVLDPGGCAGQSPLNDHQLHGVPDPTNPQ